MFKNILLATKLSTKAVLARDVAIELAKAFDAHLYVLTVFNYDFVERAQFDITTIADELKSRTTENIEKKLDEYVVPFIERGITTAKILKKGDAEKQILNAAQELQADLIIVGAGTRKGIFLDRFIQNVADKVRKKASCHVLSIV